VALLFAVEPYQVLVGDLVGKIEFLQIGVATVTCMAICGGGETELLMLGIKPESTPPASFSQGVLKADCVTV
jgi:hypothetical protein